MQISDPPATGVVQVVLFDSANAFGDLRDPVREVTFPLDGRGSYRLENVPPGEYALLVFHDENGNGRLDRNFIGIPREPLGFSNGYRPKGPPSYKRATFSLQSEASHHVMVALSRPLGRRGRLGVGLGVIARSSPYRDYKGGVYQAIPAITYIGDRLQIYGPRMQAGVVGNGKLRLAAIGEYRIGVYEEDDSPALTGMGDAESTLMAGLSLQAELPGGIDVSLSYVHDVLDRIGGGDARIGIAKSFPQGVFRIAPQIGLNWMSSEHANNDFGVAADEVLPDRPSYQLDAVLSGEIGVGVFIDITRDWVVIIDAGVEFLDAEVTRSPIVSKDYVMKGFAAVSYIF